MSLHLLEASVFHRVSRNFKKIRDKKVKLILFEVHYDDSLIKNYSFKKIDKFLEKKGFICINKNKMLFRKGYEVIYKNQNLCK